MSKDPITRVWDRIKADAEGIKFTDAAINFLQEVWNLQPVVPEGQAVFRLSLPDGRFWIEIEEAEEPEYDIEVYSMPELMVIAVMADFDQLKGCTVDYELIGLSNRLVLKHKNLETPLVTGDHIY